MSGSRSHWRRPATHVYDYNYKIGEHYYNPQLNYADKRFSGRAGSPPKAKTFAERFAEDPVYGDYGPPKWRTSATGLGFGFPRRASLGDDLGLGSGRRPGLDEDDSIFAPRRRPAAAAGLGGGRKPFDEDEFFRRRPAFEDDDDEPLTSRPRPRFDFGEKLLDAVGARGGRGRASPSPFRSGGGANAPRSARVLDDFEDDFFSRRPKPRTADPDFQREDPFKLRNAKAFGISDDLDDDDEYSRDTGAIVGRIRSKLRARREKEEALNPSSGLSGLGSNDLNDDFGPSRLDQLRSKAKARMADMDDDFADFSIKPRRTTGGDTLSNLSAKYGSDFDSGTTGGSRSVHIKKKTVRTTVDSD